MLDYPYHLIYISSNEQNTTNDSVYSVDQCGRSAAMTDTDRPTSVTDIESDRAKRVFRRAVDRNLFRGEARPEMIAPLASAFDIVATVNELDEATGPDRGPIKGNYVIDTIDYLGLALRIPDIRDPTNEPTILGLYGDRDEHASLIEAVTAPDKLYDMKLPDDERVRRIVAYVGAELLVDDIHGGLNVTDEQRRFDDADAEESVPSPADGVLGFDYVRWDGNPRTGRPLRALIYALLTEPGSPLAASDATVDRVDLFNYGSPTAEEEALPRRFTRPRLESDSTRSGDYAETAVDLQVVGRFPHATRDRSAIEAHLNRLMNAVHYLSRYEASMREDAVAPDEHGEGDRELARDGGEPLDTEFDQYPAGLHHAIDRLIKEWKNDYIGTRCRVLGDQINYSSRSTMHESKR